MRAKYRTPRLVARAWAPSDAPARKAAVDAALPQLRPWFPWAADDPRPVDAHADLLAAHAADFAAGRWWGYGVWLAPPGASDGGDGPRRLIGSVGVYRARQEAARPSTRELSYWLTPDAVGRGYAAEAVGALGAAALGAPGVLRLEIRVDPANEASNRVPPRLGFHLRERVTGDRTGRDGRPLDTLVWERRRAVPELRPATPGDLPRAHAVRRAAHGGPGRRPTAAQADACRAAVDQGLCWVWADTHGVRGCALADPTGAVRAVCVEPSAAGRGIGSLLLAQITDVLWARGHRRLTLVARAGSRGERVCRAAGWTPAERARDGAVRLAREL